VADAPPRERRGLGRGLEALLGDGAAAQSAATGGALLEIPLDAILPNPDQPRATLEPAALEALAASLRATGVLQPVVVGPADAQGRHQLIAGERRWRAARRVGLQAIPALVRETGDDTALEQALVENVQREDLNPIDEAEAYRQLMEATGLTQDQVAERVGKSRPTVANALRLLGLPPDAMEALRAGVISAGHARALLSVVNPADMRALLARAVDDGISVREAEALAGAFNKGGRTADPKTVRQKPAGHESRQQLDPDLASIEQNLIGALGTKVSIKGDSSRGSITIEYFSMDDLDRVYGIIAGDAS
jgi:ParB family transcriptional regulator, chromosome partitioning protein